MTARELIAVLTQLEDPDTVLYRYVDDEFGPHAWELIGLEGILMKADPETPGLFWAPESATAQEVPAATPSQTIFALH